jgi:peroxiredoxin
VSESPPTPPPWEPGAEQPEPSESLPQVPQHRLDPDLAAASAEAPERPAPEIPPAIDTRPYRWAIGIFGLVLVVVISIYQFASNGTASPGVSPGKRLHRFVAPLATSGVNLDANMNPRCDPAHANPQALNVCGRTPLVLAFFVTGSSACTRQVDAMQSLSRQFPASVVQFAAVAIRASKADTAAEVRSHHWTIPVAYDRDGAVGQTYGVEICPIAEISRANGVVARRLIGEHWSTTTALSGQIRAVFGRR